MPTAARGRRHTRVGRFDVARTVSSRALACRSVVRTAARGLALLIGVAAAIAAAPQRAIAQQVDLVLNVTDTPDPVPATGIVTYAVVISNSGLLSATGVTYTMSVPVNTSYAGFSTGSGASCTGMAVNAAGPGTVTCTHPGLAFNATANFSVLLRLT